MSTFVKKPALYFWLILHNFFLNFKGNWAFFECFLLDSASSEMKTEKQICYGECFVLWKLDPFLLPNEPWLPKKWIQPTHINSSLFSSAKLKYKKLCVVKRKLNWVENEPICSINVTWIRQIDQWTVIQTHKTQIDHKPMRASSQKIF